MRIFDHYGQVYIDRTRGEAFGLDRVKISRTDKGWELANGSGEARTLRIVYEDGSSKLISIENKTVLNLSDSSV